MKLLFVCLLLVALLPALATGQGSGTSVPNADNTEQPQVVDLTALGLLPCGPSRAENQFRSVVLRPTGSTPAVEYSCQPDDTTPTALWDWRALGAASGGGDVTANDSLTAGQIVVATDVDEVTSFAGATYDDPAKLLTVLGSILATGNFPFAEVIVDGNAPGIRVKRSGSANDLLLTQSTPGLGKLFFDGFQGASFGLGGAWKFTLTDADSSLTIDGTRGGLLFRDPAVDWFIGQVSASGDFTARKGTVDVLTLREAAGVGTLELDGPTAGGEIRLRDADDGGWTCCTAMDGTLSCSTCS